MLSREIDGINYRCLTTLNIETVETIDQLIFAFGEVLDRFNLVAADEAELELFQSPGLLLLMMVLPASMTLCNCERNDPEVSYCQSVTDRYFLTSECFYRLRHAVLKNVKLALRDVINRTIITIDHSNMELN
jgi:hypothetical protein